MIISCLLQAELSFHEVFNFCVIWLNKPSFPLLASAYAINRNILKDDLKITRQNVTKQMFPSLGKYTNN